MTASKINFQGISDSLVTLRKYPVLLANIPNNAADFTQKFGLTTEDGSIADFIEYCKSAIAFATKIGGPEALKAGISSNPDYLHSKTMPTDSVYASLAWESTQLFNVSSTIVTTYEQLRQELDSTSGKDGQSAAYVKKVLTGSSGLAPLTAKAAEELNAIAATVDGLLGEAQTVVSNLTSTQSSDLVNQANVTIGTLNSEVASLQKEIEKLKNNSSFLGREKRKKQIAEDEAKITEKEATLGKLQAFVGIMNTNFFVYNDNKVVQSVQSLSLLLKNAAANFQAATDQWNGICGPNGFASNQQLSDLAWVKKALEMPQSTANWQATATASEQFTSTILAS